MAGRKEKPKAPPVHCISCCYLKTGFGQKRGECRRNAPSRNGPTTFPAWPTVDVMTDWCGEHPEFKED